jgi:hypothetical protein
MNDLEKRIERLEYIARNSPWGDLIEQADRKSFDVTQQEALMKKGIMPDPWYRGYIRAIGSLLALIGLIRLVIDWSK